MDEEHGVTNQEIRNPAPGFLISWVLGEGKTQEIRNANKKSSPRISYFLGCGREQSPGNKKSSPWISYFLGFGREQNTGNKKSSPWISYFLCFWSKSMSSLNPPPIAFRRIPKLSPICCRILSPSNRQDIKSLPLLLAFGRIPKLSPICCRNPTPVHWGFG